jgi:hypothetical protein
LVYVGEEGLVTDGHFWIKMTSKLEVVPGIKEWTLALNGAVSDIMTRSTLESGVSCPQTPPQHKASYVDADGHIWVGMPLWLLVGQIDDKNVHETGAFNRTLADANAYAVKITSGDGFSVTLNSTFVNQNQNIFIANSMDGKPLADTYWPLRLTGSALKKGQMVRNVVKVELIFNTTADATKGVAVAAGGKFTTNGDPEYYGSDFDAAGLCSDDGRHLVMMPHLERAYFPWQCGFYPTDRKKDDVTPWMQAFVNARKWIGEKMK